MSNKDIIPIKQRGPSACFEVVVTQLIQSGLSTPLLAKYGIAPNAATEMQSHLLRLCTDPPVKSYLQDFHGYRTDFGDRVNLARFLYILRHFYRITPELSAIRINYLSLYLYRNSLIPLAKHYSSARALEDTMKKDTKRLPLIIKQLIEA